MSTNISTSSLLSLWTPGDVQAELRAYLRAQRKSQKISRAKLTAISGVPEPTIKRFELTGEISLRQFLLLWGAIGQLDALRNALMTKPRQAPKTIEDVLTLG